jgi:hypothetical protein
MAHWASVTSRGIRWSVLVGMHYSGSFFWLSWSKRSPFFSLSARFQLANSFLEGLPSLFEEKDSIVALRAEYEGRLNELYGDIGRLTSQLTWLKKKSGLEPEPR